MRVGTRLHVHVQRGVRYTAENDGRERECKR